VLVDAVSSLGAERVPLGDVDLCAGSSGKCLHAYPGAAFVLVSRRIRPALRKSRRLSVYMDLDSILESEDAGSPPFTPAVQLFYAFDAALDELKNEGLARRVASYAAKSARLQAGLEKLGIRFLVEKSRRSHVLTAAWLPAGVSYDKLHSALKKNRFVIYAGQSSLKDKIFRLSNLGDVRAADLDRLVRLIGRVAGKPAPAPKAVVLAAGVGRRFGERTRAIPKCLLPLGGGRTLLSRYLDSFRRCGIRDVVIVVGHLERLIREACRRHGAGLRIRFVRNPDFRRGSVLSLHRAGRELDRDVLVMDADVFFPPEALERLLSAKGSAFLLDPRSKSGGEEMMLMARNGRPVRISKKTDPSLSILGEATGIVKLERADARELKKILADFYREGILDVEYEEAYCRLLERRKIGTVGMEGLFWSEIDFEEDLEKVLSVS
jgi:choline kinase